MKLGRRIEAWGLKPPSGMRFQKKIDILKVMNLCLETRF